jgi:YbbR domain-containing protein
MTDLLRRYVLHNLGLKILSLALAIGLWYAVTREPMVEISLTVPIEFHNIQDNLEISSENIPQAEIRVRGPARIVRSLRPSDLHAEIDLKHAPIGERTYDLNSQQVRAPRELEVVQVVPSQFQLTMDTRATRKLQVRPRVMGAFPSGYRIASVTADPAEITVTGPKKRVDAVDYATTDPVDATGMMETNSFVTHAYVSDPLIQVVNPGPIHVTVIMEKFSNGKGE